MTFFLASTKRQPAGRRVVELSLREAAMLPAMPTFGWTEADTPLPDGDSSR
jgi:hypothetical protein